MDERFGVLLHEEAGRAALAEPLVATSVAVPLLVGLGSRELCERWLKRDRGGRGDRRGRPSGERLRLPTPTSRALLLLAHEDEIHALAPADVALVRQPVNDPARRVFSVRWSPTAATRIARGAQARELLAAALDRGALACAAQLLGVTRAPARPGGRLRAAARAVRPADRRLPGREAPSRQREGRARVCAPGGLSRGALGRARGTRRARSTSRTRRSPPARRRRWPPRRRSRCTARSATPGSRISTSGCGAPGRSSWPGAAAASTARASRSSFWRRAREIGPGTTFRGGN